MNAQEKLAAIQQELKAPKNQYNKFGKYYYRSAEDILEAVKPYEKKHKVTFRITEEIISIDNLDNPLVYIKSIATMTDHESGQVIGSAGTAIIDFEAKGMQMPQRTGAASSYAKKYALGNLLLLDDTKDSDAINEHGKGLQKAPATPPAPKDTPKPQPSAVKSAVKPTLKAMSKEEKTSFLKGIGEGKFSLVEKHLSKYKSDANKKAVVAALDNAKKGGSSKS
jgi:hypothetical protein